MSDKKHTKIDENIADYLGIDLGENDVPEHEMILVDSETGEVMNPVDEDCDTSLANIEDQLQAIQTAKNIQNLDHDYERSIIRRERLLLLGEQLFNDAHRQSVELESSRGAEVAGNILEMLLKESGNFDLHQKHDWIRNEMDSNPLEDKNQQTPMLNTQNNIEQAIFIGTTNDLQQQIADLQKKPEENEDVSR